MAGDLQHDVNDRDVVVPASRVLFNVLLLLAGSLLLGVLAVIPFIASAYGLGQEILAPLGLVPRTRHTTTALCRR